MYPYLRTSRTRGCAHYAATIASVGARNAEAIVLFSCEKRLAVDFLYRTINEDTAHPRLARWDSVVIDTDQPLPTHTYEHAATDLLVVFITSSNRARNVTSLYDFLFIMLLLSTC